MAQLAPARKHRRTWHCRVRVLSCSTPRPVLPCSTRANGLTVFGLSFDSRHNILLVRVSGVFNSSDRRTGRCDSPLHGRSRSSSWYSRLQQRRCRYRSANLSNGAVTRGSARHTSGSSSPRTPSCSNSLAASRFGKASQVLPEPFVVPSMDDALELLAAVDPVFESLARLSHL